MILGHAKPIGWKATDFALRSILSRTIANIQMI